MLKLEKYALIHYNMTILWAYFPFLMCFCLFFGFLFFFSYSRKYNVFRVENQTNVNKNTGEIAYKTLKPKHSTELSTRTKRESKYTKNIHNIIQI